MGFGAEFVRAWLVCLGAASREPGASDGVGYRDLCSMCEGEVWVLEITECAARCEWRVASCEP